MKTTEQILVNLTDNQTLVISNLKKGKFKTDDGMCTAKEIIDVFVGSIEIWVKQIATMEKAVKEKDERTIKFFTMSHDGSVQKTKIDWCKAIQRDINMIAKFSDTKIVKTDSLNKLNSKKSKGDRTMKATKRTTRKNRATSKSSVNFSNTISKVKSLLKGFENLSFHAKDNFLGVKVNGKRVMQVTVRNSGSNVMFNNLTLKAGKKLNKQVEERNGSAVVKEFDLKNISGLKSLLMASAKAIES